MKQFLIFAFDKLKKKLMLLNTEFVVFKFNSLEVAFNILSNSKLCLTFSGKLNVNLEIKQPPQFRYFKRSQPVPHIWNVQMQGNCH